MRKKIAFLVVCLLAFVAACSEKETVQAPPPPPDVTVIVTETKQVPLYQEFVGQIYGVKDIAIRARVEGFLEGIHFQEGAQVKKGKLLYTLESQQYEENVAARMSNVAEAKTMLAKSEGDLRRIKPLAEIKAVSESDLDTAVAMHDASIAGVQASEANLRAAKIQLGYTKIYSPINGIIGKTQAKVGDFVGRSPNPVILNTVSRIDTILVEFFITETQYLKLARALARAKPDNQEGERTVFELILVDGSLYEHKGKAEFVDREVDPTTGAMLVQTSFPNPDRILRPGQFAKVKARVRVVEDAILIPQRCITELQGLYFVNVVDNENKIQRKEVKVGPRIESNWLITEGLEPGEKVVYEGLQRARDGMVVNPTVKKIESTRQAKG